MSGKMYEEHLLHEFFVRRTQYLGLIRAVIFDWAGTGVDCGSLAPVAAFSSTFSDFGLTLSKEEIRAYMGLEKKEHVRRLLMQEHIADSWAKLHGSAPADLDVEDVFSCFSRRLPEIVKKYASPVPGCVEALSWLRARGIAIGSCTGYNRSMMEELIEAAAEMGFDPDCIVCADEVPCGRPWPWMCYENCIRLGVYPAEAVIKVGDTEADIEEGRRAGMWSVAVVRTSNAMGLSLDELEQMPPAERTCREKKIARRFMEAGAHAVITTLFALPDLVCKIEEEGRI